MYKIHSLSDNYIYFSIVIFLAIVILKYIVKQKLHAKRFNKIMVKKLKSLAEIAVQSND